MSLPSCLQARPDGILLYKRGGSSSYQIDDAAALEWAQKNARFDEKLFVWRLVT